MGGWVEVGWEGGSSVFHDITCVFLGTITVFTHTIRKIRKTDAEEREEGMSRGKIIHFIPLPFLIHGIRKGRGIKWMVGFEDHSSSRVKEQTPVKLNKLTEASCRRIVNL